MVFAEDIRSVILRLADQRSGQVFYATEVARTVDPKNWKNLMGQVRLVVSVLIKEGKIILRNQNSTADISGIKGPIRLSKAPQ